MVYYGIRNDKNELIAYFTDEDILAQRLKERFKVEEIGTEQADEVDRYDSVYKHLKGTE